MKRTIELDDTHDETLAAARADLRTWFERESADNPDTDPDDLEPGDQIHEIADSATPIFAREIDTWHFLYGNALRAAYDDAGLGNGHESNYLQVCLYAYIEADLWECWRELVAEAQAARDERPNPRERGDDDGVEYADPTDEQADRLTRD